MKILLVSSAYVPTVNGVVTHVQSLRNDLIEMGHEVWVLAPERRGFEDVEERVFRLKSVSNPLNSDYPLAFGFFYPRSLRKVKFDIVHMHHPFGVTAVALRARNKSKAKLVFTNHTQYETYTEYYAPLISKLLKKVIRKLLKGLYWWCDIVLCSTKDIEKYVRGIYDEAKVKIIPVGFNDKALIPSFKEGETRRKYGIKKENLYVLYAGRIAEEKNLDFLIDSVNEVHKSNNRIRLVIVGGGDYQKELSEKASDHIFFAGSLPPAELASYYRDCDLFASTSVTETLGLVFAEAAYCGAALLGIDSDGVRDVIKDGENGILAKDEETFTKTLKDITDKKIDLRDFKAKAKESSLYFSASTNSIKVEAIYKALLNNKT